MINLIQSIDSNANLFRDTFRNNVLPATSQPSVPACIIQQLWENSKNVVAVEGL